MRARKVKRRSKTSRVGATSERASSARKQFLVEIAIALFLAAIVWLAFGQTLHNGFVSYDDGDYVYKNPEIINGLTFSGIEWAFTHVHAANWHPLTTISHMLDCQLYGLQPWGHHLSNILLQAAAAILLFLALRKLTRSLWPSAFVAALFAIHPLRVESVAWVSERKDVLSGVFFMLTLLAYARYARSDRHSLGKYITVVALFALGLMCKPTLVTLPFVLLLLDYWPLARLGSKAKDARPGRQWSWARPAVMSGLHLVTEKIPLFALSAASCLATILAQKRALETHPRLSLIERAGNAVVSYVTYVGQMFYPEHLAVLYPYPEGDLGMATVIPAFLFLLIVSAVFFFWRRKYPFLLVGWLWYLGMLIPMIGLVQVGSQARADRYTYLPQIGLYLLVTWGVMELFTKWGLGRKLLAVPALLVIGVLTACTYHETFYWENSETLWKHAIDDTANNDIAHYNLGSVLLRKDQPEAAIVEFQKALQINPGYGDADVDTGSALMLMGRTDQAMSYFRKALQIKPDFAEAWSNLGSALLQKEQVEEAIQCYEKALAIKPGSADMQYNLGRAFARKGDWGGAIASYEAALRIQPNSAKVHNGMGVALAEVGKTDEALKELGEALRINPNYPEAHYNLGCVLAHLGRREEATAQLAEALRLKPDYHEAEEQLRELGESPR